MKTTKRYIQVFFPSWIFEIDACNLVTELPTQTCCPVTLAVKNYFNTWNKHSTSVLC